MGLGDFWDSLFAHRKTPVVKHELKWPLPEARLSVPLEEPERIVGELKKSGARFLSGGEFSDVVHAKQYAEGVFAYFIVRTDKKTDKEYLIADAYMLQEQDRLGIEVTSGYPIIEDLDKMGYKKALNREVTEWRFVYAGLPVKIFEITGFASFLEISLPATKIAKTREANEETAFGLLKKLGFRKEDAIPTDVITLQIMSETDAAAQGGGGAGGAQGGAGGAGFGMGARGSGAGSETEFRLGKSETN